MGTIAEILIDKDNMSAKEADELIDLAKEDLFAKLDAGESADDICSEWFGLEPDYIDELIG